MSATMRRCFPEPPHGLPHPFYLKILDILYLYGALIYIADLRNLGDYPGQSTVSRLPGCRSPGR